MAFGSFFEERAHIWSPLEALGDRVLGYRLSMMVILKACLSEDSKAKTKDHGLDRQLWGQETTFPT